MPTTINKPEERIDAENLSKEKFGSAGIKLSTKKRLKRARILMSTSFENDRYLLIERALELYYHNTTVFYGGRDRNLLELINEREV